MRLKISIQYVNTVNKPQNSILTKWDIGIVSITTKSFGIYYFEHISTINNVKRVHISYIYKKTISTSYFKLEAYRSSKST